MKSYRNRGPQPVRLLAVLSAAGLLCFSLVGRGALEEWVQTIEGIGRFETVFFRPVSMPGGEIIARRPPKEARAALDDLVSKAPSDAELYLMRARVGEQQLDFAAAEADWKKRAQLLPDGAAGQLELADFYHRRLRPADEIKALEAVTRSPSPSSERLLPSTEQRSWRAFERIYTVIDAQALPVAVSVAQYHAWLDRYPKEPSVYANFFSFLLDRAQFNEAERLISAYGKAFPDDKEFPVQAKASLEYRRGSIDQALDLYDHAFQPLWPAQLVQSYFNLLRETHRLRNFLTRARAAINSTPDDVSAAARVFYYYQQQGNLAEAQSALFEYRMHMEYRKAKWTVAQLWTLGRLFEETHNYDEAARYYYALYSLAGADETSAEKGLGGIINLLLSAPEQPIRFGLEDFSFLRDVGTMDPYPGFLNGILSLLLNSQSPAQQYAQQEPASAAYFHRARAAELLALYDSRFPGAPARADLHAKLLDVYANYGESDAVIRDGRRFLAAFPKSPQRLHVAMALADALARKGQAKDEMALYDSLLEELAARAGRVPLGSVSGGGNFGLSEPEEPAYSLLNAQQEMEGDENLSRPVRRPVRVMPPTARSPRRPNVGARSPEYSQVLERYISRLVELKQAPQALALLRREIDRNPNDPGLYERLALFLDQNRMAAGIEEVYRRAIQQFPDRTWYHKLARFYLRHKRMAEFEKLTREIVDIFAGSDLEKYFHEVLRTGNIDSYLFRQVNLYAHQRFPHNLTFVRNLLDVYRRRGTYDQTAWERLMRQNWAYDEGLRSAYFTLLSGSNRLDTELQAVRALNPPAAGGRWQELVNANPPAAQFIAEAELWRSRFEAAAPLLRAIAAEFPADVSIARRASALHRSLAAFDPEDTDVAAAIEENLSRFAPTDGSALVRIGEIFADREMFGRSRPYWNRVAEMEPGKAGGYLEAATVFWDYYLFDDALRLVHQVRKKLENPALYSYEAGAIYENKRDFARAVEEYLRGALADEGTSPARSRLLELAKRPETRPLVEEATMKQVSAQNPDWAAVSLRVELLQTLNRQKELEGFLAGLTGSATSLELLERIEPIAEREGFDAVRVRLLERRASLTADPIERLRSRIALSRLQEARGDVEEARRMMESVYAENPTILGVVRSSADFYWRNKMPGEAIDTLLRAASASYPGLKAQFTFEAARKADDAKQYARARALLAPLLQEDPFNAEYLAVMADCYAREGDDKALRNFYLAQIKAHREAPFPPEEKASRTAALRRGLIPALTRLKDYAGGLDQYVEVLNRFPEDEGLTQEAAAYANRYNRRKQLLDYYTKAAADSPRDFRWPMVLARIQTYFEDYPSGIASYSKALQIRPDRVDLLTARAALEERLMRFDVAVQGYTQLYELSYQNPQWMGKMAEVRARQGQTEAAVTALRKALIDGRPERPEIFFAAAERLESWGMLRQARDFAERGASLAGPELLSDEKYLPGAKVCARVLTRLRGYETAYALFERAGGANAHIRSSVLQEMGQTVRDYFTPEERMAFVEFAKKLKSRIAPDEFAEILVPMAQSAGLAELEAQWRYELMMARPGTPESGVHETRLIALQRGRMKFNDLGAQLESYWNAFPNIPGKDSILHPAASSYWSAGNTAAELRVLATLFGRGELGGETLERYLELLLSNDRPRLLAITATAPLQSVRNSAANFAIASGDGNLALQAIQARGRDQPPVWTRAYTGLVGLYYSHPASEVDRAYLAALGPRTIGERVGKPVNRGEQLAGDIWFYYGSRYGEYLDVTKHGIPEDYLPAMLESAPGSAGSYFTLAEYYRNAGKLDRALADYSHTLELDSNRGDAHDRMAMIFWQQGKHDEAIASWKEGLRAFGRREKGRRIEGIFWEDVRVTLQHIGERKSLSEVRREVDGLLKTYVQRNGSYRASSLLEAAVEASADPATGIAWVLDLSNRAQDPATFLGDIVNAKWVPQAQKEVIFRRIVEIARERVARQRGAARTAASEVLREWRIRWLAYLVGAKQTERAEAALEEFSDEQRRAMAAELTPLEIRIAAQAKRLEATLERFRQEDEKGPSFESLRDAATALKKDGDEASSRRVLEFAYARDIERHNLTPTNFLGLAEIRLESGDVSAALAILRRMALVSGEPFENLDSAAELLRKMGHASEAAEFLAARVKSTPWDSAARLQLARAQFDSNRKNEQTLILLQSVLTSNETPYALRLEAAKTLGQLKAGGQNSASTELDLLSAGGPVDKASSMRPFFYDSRLRAAELVPDPGAKIRLLLDAIAINPQNDIPRLSLFRIAAGTGQPRLALSSIEPLLEGERPYFSGFRAYRFEGTAEGEDSETETYFVVFAADRFVSRTGLDAVQRASLARELASVFERLDQLHAAAICLGIANHLEPSKKSQADLKLKLQSIQTELKRRVDDASRRPTVTVNLEQKGLVRPRLLPAQGQSRGPKEGGKGR